MFKGSSRSLFRLAFTASILAAIAVLTGCGANEEQSVKSAPVAVVPKQIAMLAASINRDLPPTSAQTKCTNEADFFQADSTSNANALINRHVLCVKDTNTDSVTIYDTVNKIDVHNAGEATVYSKLSVHGGSSALQKTATLSLRYTYKDLQPDLKLAAPKLTVRAAYTCIGQSTSDVKCDASETFTLTPNAAAIEKNTTLAISWNESLEKIIKTTIGVKMFYTTDGSTPESQWTNKTTVVEPRFASWLLRCDIDQAKNSTRGCVFPDASAVWDFSQAGGAPQNQSHIAFSFANLPEVPGKFRLAEGQRSVAMDEQGSGFTALNRTRVEKIRLDNRNVSYARCEAMYSGKQASACSDGANCECDEFPPASTLQGAFFVQNTPQKYSVRSINGTDNGTAGGYLAAFYLKERVIDNEQFWVHVGNAPTTPPPPTPPPPPPVVVTSQLSITSTESDWGNGIININYRITNNGPKDIVGPFRLYYTNLDSRISLDPNCRSQDGRRFVDIGHASIGSQISVGAAVTATVPAGVNLNTKYELVAGNGTGSCSWERYDPRPPIDNAT